MWFLLKVKPTFINVCKRDQVENMCHIYEVNHYKTYVDLYVSCDGYYTLFKNESVP